MNCPTCGESLEIRDVSDGATTYTCPNGHWWLLSQALGLLVIPAPQIEPNPDALGVGFG